MNILLLGDIVGPSGRRAITKNLPNIIKKKKIDFVVANGENAADPGIGITKKNVEEFKNAGGIGIHHINAASTIRKLKKLGYP